MRQGILLKPRGAGRRQGGIVIDGERQADQGRVYGPADFTAAEVSVADGAGQALQSLRKTGCARLKMPEAPGKSAGTDAEETGFETALPHLEL